MLTIGGPATNRGVPIGWAGVDEEEAFAGLVHAHDLGVTLYDTADVYGMGRSERLLGRLLKQVDRRALTIAGKVGHFAGTAAHPYTRRQILRQFETTLDNLGTDYLDAYFLHSSDFGPDDRYFDEAVTALEELRTEGAIKAIGIRAPHAFAKEWAEEAATPDAGEAARFTRAFACVRPDVLTVRHNILSPLYSAEETDVFALARSTGVGILIKQALGQGLLIGAGNRLSPAAYPHGDHRRNGPAHSGPALRAIHEGLDRLRERFGFTDADLIRVALRYVLQHAPEAAVLVGFRNATQIGSDITSLGEPLSIEDVSYIRSVMTSVRQSVAETNQREKHA
ncbi:aldo/keto reductase [Streptomyces sp. NPDC092296]|uniref:aldo/keto reductase n=1 Tax=Streptomyces sp. NPDC092296 TaxID=3366012 RepID=UPI0037F3B068